MILQAPLIRWATSSTSPALRSKSGVKRVQIFLIGLRALPPCRLARSAGMAGYSRINESNSTTRMVTMPCARVAAVWAL